VGSSWLSPRPIAFGTAGAFASVAIVGLAVFSLDQPEQLATNEPTTLARVETTNATPSIGESVKSNSPIINTEIETDKPAPPLSTTPPVEVAVATPTEARNEPRASAATVQPSPPMEVADASGVEGLSNDRVELGSRSSHGGNEVMEEMVAMADDFAEPSEAPGAPVALSLRPNPVIDGPGIFVSKGAQPTETRIGHQDVGADGKPRVIQAYRLPAPTNENPLPPEFNRYIIYTNLGAIEATDRLKALLVNSGSHIVVAKNDQFLISVPGVSVKRFMLELGTMGKITQKPDKLYSENSGRTYPIILEFHKASTADEHRISTSKSDGKSKAETQ